METEKKETCPACDGPMNVRCAVGAFYLCRKCATQGCVEQALRIAMKRHKERLEMILTENEGLEV